MWRYLKAAFAVRPRLGAWGPTPVMTWAVVASLLAAAWHPWITGIGLASVGLACVGLAAARPFRRVVDAEDNRRALARLELRRAHLIETLPLESRRRAADLQRTCARILALHEQGGATAGMLETNRDALDRLQWLYVKLLLAEHTLLTGDAGATARSLVSQIGQAQHQLNDPDLSLSHRQSIESTIVLLQKRLNNLAERERTLAEIDSNLRHIRAHVDLALDEAAMRGTPAAINANIELAGHMLDQDLFGPAAPDILGIDAAIGSRGRLAPGGSLFAPPGSDPLRQ